MNAEVAVLAPIPGPYTYQVPPRLQGEVQVGSRVWVPLRERHVEGIVLRLRTESAGPLDGDPMGAVQDDTARPLLHGKLREILQRVEGPGLPPDLLSLGQFIAEYYLVPQGEALRLVLPPGIEARAARQVVLSPSGAALCGVLGGALLPPEAADLSGLEQDVLLALFRLEPTLPTQRALRPVAIARLVRALGPRAVGLAKPDLTRALSRLGHAGFIELTEELRAGVRPLVEERVTLLPSTEPPPRGNIKAGLLLRLAKDGPLTLEALQQEVPRAREHVRALAAAGRVSIARRELFRDPLDGKWGDAVAASGEGHPDLSSPLHLNPPQAQALAEMTLALDRIVRLTGQGSEPCTAAPGALGEPCTAAPGALGGPTAFLLHGITGSGKTEVYLQLIAQALQRGRTALVLVPEIGLTPQLLSRFRARFGPDVAVLHSALSQGERADAWRRLARGEVRIALGPRSALFAPLSHLGVVIVDEEHDSSFKQQDGVRYHGRDVALVRAQRAGALAVLGSATPSLEAMAMVQQGKVRLLTLPKRATGAALPKVQIVDLRQHLLPEDALISAPLHKALEETLLAGEQSILFLNRRGYATFLLCKGCGHRFECKNCAVTLTWHKGHDHLLCHYCGFRADVPTRCSACDGQKIERLGIGTEKIEEQIASRFPTARVARLDRDTAEGPGLSRVLAAMHRREIDILVGTQMLAKGHDFPYVTLVGVVLADTGMGLPDFRAGERTFQLLAQVAGRAGRAERPGRVIVQTFNPQHPAILCSAEHDYVRFATDELLARKELNYPPFSRLAALRFDGVDPVAVREAAELVAVRARQVVNRAPESAVISLLGPAEAPLSRLKGRTRWQLFVRAANVRALRTVVRAALDTPVHKGIRLSVDIDPVSTL